MSWNYLMNSTERFLWIYSFKTVWKIYAPRHTHPNVSALTGFSRFRDSWIMFVYKAWMYTIKKEKFNTGTTLKYRN